MCLCGISAKEIAENASFQAFINCYIREASETEWLKKDDLLKNQQLPYLFLGEEVIEVTLPLQEMRFILEVEYRSQVGRHTLGSIYKYHAKERSWCQEEPLSVMIACIQELHLNAKVKGCPQLAPHYDELILRLIDSYHTMTTYIEGRIDDIENFSYEMGNFIDSEQSLLFGHWLHPTPKSRQGMATWQHDCYAPELSGSFQLHFFEVDPSYIEEQSVIKKKPTEIVEDMAKRTFPEYTRDRNKVLLPMHPLQAQWLLQQEYIQKAINDGIINYLGGAGEEFSATSSIRTVYHVDENWMYKFSIPVKVTNSLRVNKVHELKAGVVMAELLQNIDFLEKHPQFHVIDDPGYIMVNLPDRSETGFEIILRSNPFHTCGGKGIVSIAALVQDPIPGSDSMLKNHIRMLAFENDKTVKNISLEWFKRYWVCTVEPMLYLYEEYGVALEAHQQNSLLDLSSGFPSAYYFRDNQGYYLSSSYRPHLENCGVDMSGTPELFYEEELINNRFAYYLFINHIFSVIHRFGVDELLEEIELLGWMVDQLRNLEGRLSNGGKRFIQYLLTQEEIACKANLMTRFHDVDELCADLEQAVYTTVPNPIHQILTQEVEEKEYASAYPV